MLVSVRLYLVHLDSACLKCFKTSASNSVEHVKKKPSLIRSFARHHTAKHCSNVHNYFLRIKIKTLVYSKFFLEQTKGYMMNIIDWDAPTHQKKKIATWLIFGLVVGHTMHQENAHSCSQNEILYIPTTKKRYQYTHTTLDTIPQPVRHTYPTLNYTESLSKVQVIKSCRYLHRSVTPTQPLIKRNFYQGCKWSSPADTSTGLSHLPNPELNGISIKGASDLVQPIPKPVHHTYPTLN